MDKRLPIVAQAGSATISGARRQEGSAVNPRRKPYAASRRESRRASCATQHRVFAGYTMDTRAAEAQLKPDIAWCEQNCQGLWNIVYGPFYNRFGYQIRFGFTESGDAGGFERFRQERRSQSEISDSEANER